MRIVTGARAGDGLHDLWLLICLICARFLERGGLLERDDPMTGRQALPLAPVTRSHLSESAYVQ